MAIGNNIGLDLLSKGVETSLIPYEAISTHWLMPVLFIVLMSMFYITSSDSQSYAMDVLISRGNKTPVVYRKILWVFLEVVFVTVLLLAGSGTVSAVQGLSFLLTPFMILFALINVFLIIRFVYNRYVNKVVSIDEEIQKVLEFKTKSDLTDYQNAYQDEIYKGLLVMITSCNTMYLYDGSDFIEVPEEEAIKIREVNNK